MVYLFMLICSSFLIVPEQAHATDTAAVAAALKDEASECRYLQQLCENAHNARRASSEALKISTEKTEELKKANTKVLLDETGEAIARAKITQNAFIGAMTELADAIDVVKAKHPQMPKCFKMCSLE